MAKNLTVLELGDGYSSGYCGRLLAGTGARVVKVEDRLGSPLRTSMEDIPFSAPFTTRAPVPASSRPQ